ncbi:MAG: methyltransferase [Candidatus Wildermuthbacteria bacterium]|nr:methyltransferase [Candidatus Wildermuthbacteria bacterium]
MEREIQWLLEEKYHGRLTPSAKKDIARLQKGEHVDYVIGFVDFLGCRIDLSSRPLIPRPETEYWVKGAIEHMLGNEILNNRFVPPLRGRRSARSTICPPKAEPCQIASASLFRNLLPSHSFRCLDLFAGSGCIGVAVLKHIPRVHVDFGEKDKRLLSQIRLNAKKNGIKKARYRVIQTDLFSDIKEKYDYIFANPPYIAESKKSRVQPSVLKHEPREALFAGSDGLDRIRPFLNRVKDFLVEGGVIYLEFDSFQKQPIDQYLKKVGYQSWQFFRDQYDKWRFAMIQT